MLGVRLSPQPERVYLRVDAPTRRRHDRVFAKPEQGRVQHPNIRALRGPLAGSLRFRLGAWRIVFSVDAEGGVVWIEAITTRGGAYR